MTGGCANVTTGSATGCQWPSCRLAGAEHLDQPYPGGESWRQAVARVGRFLGDLPLRWDGRRILVIGHVATRWGLDHLIGGVPLEDLIEQDFAWQEGWEYRIS
jgi:2,3-bisphosphoglycerate-dependent phosphoglycerate mutase